MHASNVLGNRIEVYAPQKDGIALTDRNRINTAVHEDDRPFFRGSQACRDEIEGHFPL